MIKLLELKVKEVFEGKVYYYKIRHEEFYGLCGASFTYHKIPDKLLTRRLIHCEPESPFIAVFFKWIKITKVEFDKNTKVGK